MNALDKQLEVGIASIREGRKSLGRTLLLDVVKHRPRDLNAWLWLSRVSESDQERLNFLQKVLEIEPGHLEATRRLTDFSPPVSEQEPETLLASSEETLPPQKKRRRRRRRRKASSISKLSGLVISSGRRGRKGKRIRRSGTKGKRRGFTSLACVLAVLTLFYFKFIVPSETSLGTSIAKASSGQTKKKKRPISSSQLGLLPLSMSLSPPSGGWHSVRIKLAFENRSKFFRRLIVPTGQGTILTEESYRYPSTINQEIEGVFSLGQPLFWLPPGFSFWQIYSHDQASVFQAHYEIKTRVAENSRPKKVSFPGYNDIDLRDIAKTVLPFPIVNEETVVYGLGHVVELPREKARLRIEGIKREKLQFTPKGPVSDLFIVSVSQENLNPGYEKKITFFTIAISGDGVVGSLPQSTIGSIEQCTPFPILGPNQKAVVAGCTVMPEGETGVKIILAIETGNSHEFVVIDSGY